MQGEGLRGHVLISMDRALELVRRASGPELFAALVPGGVLSMLALGVYYAERVEGVRVLRPLFAIAFTLAYLGRALVLARWSGRRAAELLAHYRVEKPQGPSAGIARAALWVGLDLWFWLWILVLAVHLDPWFVPVALPLFAVRGALLPSWLACADATPDASGFRVLRRAVELSEGRRGQGMLLELLLALAAIGLAINLAALGAGAVSVGEDMLGLDLALTQAFLSSKNHFALLFVMSFALTLLEPLRAALSAVLFTDALLSREGIAVRSLVVRAVEPRSRPRQAAALVAALWLGSVPLHARAQAEPGDTRRAADETLSSQPAVGEEGEEGEAEEAEEDPCEGACLRAREADADVETRAEHILGDRAFTEFPEENWSMDQVAQNALSDWIENVLLPWLFGNKSEDEAASPPEAGKPLALPSAGFFLVVAAVILVLLLLLMLHRARTPRSDAGALVEAAEDPLKRPAEEHLQEAVTLSARDLSLALRSLYLATLVGLERRNLLGLSPERTNGQYLRELPDGDDRRMFASFTRVFDAVHYGARVPSLDDFRTCRMLAERLIAGALAAGASASAQSSRPGAAP
jgi:hypothetical protein